MPYKDKDFLVKILALYIAFPDFPLGRIQFRYKIQPLGVTGNVISLFISFGILE